jgi:hypothetical protein
VDVYRRITPEPFEFSPDIAMRVVAEHDGIMTLRRLPDYRTIATSDPRRLRPRRLSPDGRRWVTADWPGKLWLWTAPQHAASGP